MLIRHWQPDDAATLRPMILDCLTSTFAAGADLAPTPNNVELLLRVGMKWAERGEPTLVIVVGEHVVGYTLWGGAPHAFGLELRDRVCFGLGTYILPACRNGHLATELRKEALQVARSLGYNRVQGVAYEEAGIQSVLPLGFRVNGIQVEAVL